jgi:type II secretory pathway component HofQ
MKKTPLLFALPLALLAAAAFAADPPAPQPLRLPLQAAVAETMAAKLAVSEYWFGHQAWPANLSDTSYQPLVTTSIGEGGVITLTMQGPDDKLAGKSLQLTPTLAPDGAIEWKCSSKDVPAKLLPEGCK